MTVLTQKKQLDPNRIPLPGEFELANTYRKADEVDNNLSSWSRFDRLKFYEDTLDCIELLEEEINGPAFDILMRVKLNVEKIFGSEKA